MKTQELPYVVVLNITYSGYGIVRSLAPYNIPVVAFQKDVSRPEAKSKLWEALINFRSDTELLERLINFSNRQEQKPGLMITADEYVEFFLKYRDDLEKHFLIHYPANQVVELLLSKERFSAYAGKNAILIPKSGVLENGHDLENFQEEYDFPVALKPYTKSSKWQGAGFPKIFIVHSFEELQELYKKISQVENNLLVQEWIPGPDSNVHYCLVYFNDKHECLAAFTGFKIRQWPVGTGSTATTMPVENEWIRNETIRILSDLDYAGFGAIEYKRHEGNGRYYITEPTVGRPDQQEYVATLNGMNILLIAYNSLTGLNIQEERSSKGPVIYIDEWAELYSTLTHFKRKLLTFKEWRQSIKGHRAYRFWSKEDKDVFLASLFWNVKALVKKVSMEIPRRCYEQHENNDLSDNPGPNMTPGSTDATG